MNITEENNETVVRFGRILSRQEIALLDICLAFFQSDETENVSLDNANPAGESPSVINDGQIEKS
jgi:hypothetical protein